MCLVRFLATAFFLESLNWTVGSDEEGGTEDCSDEGISDSCPEDAGIGFAITIGGWLILFSPHLIIISSRIF